MEITGKERLFQVQSSMTKISTMSNWLRIQFDTIETLSPEAYKRLFELNNKQGWLSFNVNMIEFGDVLKLPPVRKVEGKSKSERLRNVLYRLWEKDCKDKSFDDFYEYYIEYLIYKIKERLND